MHAVVYSALVTAENLRRSTLQNLLVTLEWTEFGGCAHKIHPVELNWTAILDNGLFLLYHVSFAVRSAITATAELLVTTTKSTLQENYHGYKHGA